MADFYIREFRRLSRDSNGAIVPVGEEPGVDTKLTTGATPQSHTLDAGTAFVEVHSSGAPHHFTFSGSAADTDSMVLPDGATSFRGLGVGSVSISVRTA